MFLEIVTSCHERKISFKSLPRKMIIGFFTLILSIATMMATSCASLFVILPRKLRIVIPVICLASVPVALFTRCNFAFFIIWSFQPIDQES
ncbi:hypothetical protein CFP56_015569 [Quercus suber]|uniref:Uncharacterized protein n=1 Tax=Quercus suber TaxID=58331 RepID=A0AAW0KRX8_QUESU